MSNYYISADFSLYKCKSTYFTDSLQKGAPILFGTPCMKSSDKFQMESLIFIASQLNLSPNKNQFTVTKRQQSWRIGHVDPVFKLYSGLNVCIGIMLRLKYIVEVVCKIPDPLK